MRVGDLVRFPHSDQGYWWSEKVAVIDLIEPYGDPNVRYRAVIPGVGYARFSDPDFVEVISESR
jgi:hypothetical protein